MKERYGFVSNSSSSSFICQICGHVEEGWDWQNHCIDIIACVHGHTFCKNHALEIDAEFYKLIRDDTKIPEKYCPICNGFYNVGLKDIYNYLESRKMIHISFEAFEVDFNSWKEELK